jgi:hypothetical protein
VTAAQWEVEAGKAEMSFGDHPKKKKKHVVKKIKSASFSTVYATGVDGSCAFTRVMVVPPRLTASAQISRCQSV